MVAKTYLMYGKYYTFQHAMEGEWPRAIACRVYIKESVAIYIEISEDLASRLVHVPYENNYIHICLVVFTMRHMYIQLHCFLCSRSEWYWEPYHIVYIRLFMYRSIISILTTHLYVHVPFVAGASVACGHSSKHI